MRKEFASFVKSKVDDNDKLCVLLGDISVGLFLDKNDMLPKRVYNVGILEQSMVSMAAGISQRGYQVILHTISPFMIERAYEQIKLDVSYNRNKVIMVSANGPADYNKLGPTHHCFSDVPILKMIPDFEIFLPGRREDVTECLALALESNNSSYVRLTSRVASLPVRHGVINNPGTSNELNIFIGESLSFLETGGHDLSAGDWLYSYKVEGINCELFKSYSSLKFWEPYSKPIAALHYRQMLSAQMPIISMTYPLSYESGIFEHPGFLERIV